METGTDWWAGDVHPGLDFFDFLHCIRCACFNGRNLLRLRDSAWVIVWPQNINIQLKQINDVMIPNPRLLTPKQQGIFFWERDVLQTDRKTAPARQPRHRRPSWGNKPQMTF